MYANRYVCTLTIRCSDINHSPFVYPFHRDIGNFVCFAFPFLLAFRPVLRQQNHWSASLDVGSHVVKKPRARRIFRFDFNHLNRSMINHRFGFQMIATNDDDDDESFEIGSQSIWCQIGIPTLSIFVIESLYFVASILLLRLGLRQKTVNLSGRFRRARAAEYTKSKWTVLSVIQKVFLWFDHDFLLAHLIDNGYFQSDFGVASGNAAEHRKVSYL